MKGKITAKPLFDFQIPKFSKLKDYYTNNWHRLPNANLTQVFGWKGGVIWKQNSNKLSTLRLLEHQGCEEYRNSHLIYNDVKK